MRYANSSSWIARSAIALVAAGVVVGAIAGCSSDPQSPNPSGLIEPSSDTADSGVVDVDASDYIVGSSISGDHYYAWRIDNSVGERITDCAIAPTATSPTTGAAGEHFPDCLAVFPPDTHPVSSPPFEGQPNAVRITAEGVVDYISEGFSGLTVTTLRELAPGSRITVGDVQCLSLAEGGIDCAKGDKGFQYSRAGLTKREVTTPASVTVSPPETSPDSQSLDGPPVGGPYTEGTTPAAVGTNCGAATGDIVVTVVTGSISCADALAVMKQYLALPNDGSYGNANIRQFDGWSCASPTAVSAQEQGFGSKCSKESIVLTKPLA